MSNEVPLEKQLFHLALSKGVNERDRPETADPATTLTRLENLVQDQTGGYVKRAGLVAFGTTDDASNALVLAKVLRTSDSLAAIGQDGKFYQYEENLAKFRRRGDVPAMHVKSDMVTSSGASVKPAVYSSSTGSKYHVILHAAGLSTSATIGSIHLTIYDRASGSVIATYNVGSMNSAGQALGTLVDDRYYHMYQNTAGGIYCTTVDLNSALPADESVMNVNTVLVSAQPGSLYDVTRGYQCSYLAAAQTTSSNIFRTTNARVVTLSASIGSLGANIVTQISVGGSHLWYMTSGNIGALDTSTLAVTVAAAAHGGAATAAYLGADLTDVCWVANEVTTTVGGTSVTSIELRKTNVMGTALTKYATVDAWKIASTPFDMVKSGGSSGRSVYLHVTKDSSFTVVQHAVLSIDPNTISTLAIGGQTYTSVPPAAAPDSMIGVVNSSGVLRANSSSITATDVECGVMVALQTSARACAYTVAVLSTVSQSKTNAIVFGGQNYLSGGCQTMYGGGNQPVESGFIDMPRLSAQVGAAGLPSGNYKYVAQYRYVDETGAVTWSRTSPVESVSLAAQRGTVTIVPPAVTLKELRKGTTQVSPKVSVELYRTVSGGTTYYLCASNAAGTPLSGLSTQAIALGVARLMTVTDNLPDGTLVSQPTLFRQPGTPNSSVDRYPAPATDVICQHKDRIFIGDPYGTRVYYSSFFVDGETAWYNPAFSFFIHGASGPITGLVSMDGRLFAFKRDGIFVIDGDGPAEGGVAGNEFSAPQRLATEYGCIDGRSIVVTTDGIVYRSARGIELLTRSLQVKWVGDRVQNTVNANPYTGGAVLDAFGRVRIIVSASDQEGGLASASTGAELVWDIPADAWTVHYHTPSNGVYGNVMRCITMVNLTGYGEVVVYADPLSGACRADSSTGLDRSVYYTPWVLETAWIRTGQQTRHRFSRALLLAKKNVSANHRIRMSVAYDYIDDYTSQVMVFEPSVINDGFIEELESQILKPMSLSIRLKVEELAPTDTATYPIGTGRGCDLLGVTFEIAQVLNAPMLAATKKGVLQGAGPVGTVPVITGAPSYAFADVIGGGQRIVVPVNSSVGCTGITAGAVAFTSFAIDDATHVSGIPGAHAAGVVDIVVTNATGPSTTGTGLLEYFDTASIFDLYLDGTQYAFGTWTARKGTSPTQVSAPAQPIVGAALGGRATVDFDGTNHFVQGSQTGDYVTHSDYFAFTLFTARTAAWAGGDANAFNNSGLWSDNADGYIGQHIDAVVGAQTYAFSSGAKCSDQAISVGTGTWNGLLGKLTAGNLYSRLGSAAWSAGTAAATPLANVLTDILNVGTNYTRTRMFDGRIAVLAIAKVVPSDANITKLLGTINQQWGTTL